MSQNSCHIGKSDNQNAYLKSFLAGVLGAILLSAFYWLVLFIVTKDPRHPLEQFFLYKYWIIFLIVGFGVQMGLFWYIRSGKHLNGSSKTAISAGASTSTVAMVACCAHHLVDLMPIFGFSAAALFLTKHQTYFFSLGIISNILGILLMSYIIKTKKHPDFLKFFFKKIKKYE
jgi:hypothetical protein